MQSFFMHSWGIYPILCFRLNLQALPSEMSHMESSDLMLPRVLIVDDESLVREVLRLRLQHDGGYEFDEAGTGREAIALLKKNHYDLVITDIMMPDEDGIATINFLRKEAPDTHVFAVSASPNDLFLKTAEKLGAKRTFTKPFPLDDLAEAVHDILIAKKV